MPLRTRQASRGKCVDQPSIKHEAQKSSETASMICTEAFKVSDNNSSKTGWANEDSSAYCFRLEAATAKLVTLKLI